MTRIDHMERWISLTEKEIERLATYNAERFRGLVHTAEYAEEMRVLQERFNDWRQRETF